MSIERDKDFEQLEDIAAMMTENPGIEFENGKYVYYGLDARTAFAVVYIGGAWAGWQAAKAQAVPEVLKKFCNEHKDPAWRGRLTEYDKGYSDCCIDVLEMIEAQEPK